MNKQSITIISNLYPNCVETTKGLFIKQLTDSISDKANVTVIAPLPFNPLDLLRGGSPVPAKEIIDGIEVYHPRYIVIPKMARSLTGRFFYWGIKGTLKKLIAQGKADILSAHWMYPDGYGAVLAAKKFDKPIAVHALGCDINEYTKFKIRRKLITHALTESNVNIVKSQKLKDKITSLGVSEDKTKVILNGVDQNKFKRTEQNKAREHLNLNQDKKYVLFIGNFQIEKGLANLIDAVNIIKEEEFHLLVIGGGPLESQVKQQITELKLEDKITLIGRVEHHQIPDYLSAADILCLPSLREGCPNVVLESLSSGTPVVASDVGAVPDIISKPEWGVIVEPDSAPALAQGITEGLNLDKSNMPVFEWYDWQKNADLVLEQFETISNPT